MSPTCQNCGGHVSEHYARVMCPSSVDQPQCCPSCPDMVRKNGQAVQARSSRLDARAVSGGPATTEVDD